MAQEDEVLLAAEAQLPGGDDEIHWSELESDSSEDVKYFPAAPASHDHGAGGSREPAPESPAAATVTESQVTQPSELTSLLQQLVTQQREDRIAQRRPGEPMRLSLQPFRGRLPESVLQPSSILLGLLTEFHRGQMLSFSRCSRA